MLSNLLMILLFHPNTFWKSYFSMAKRTTSVSATTFALLLLPVRPISPKYSPVPNHFSKSVEKIRTQPLEMMKKRWPSVPSLMIVWPGSNISVVESSRRLWACCKVRLWKISMEDKRSRLSNIWDNFTYFLPLRTIILFSAFISSSGVSFKSYLASWSLTKLLSRISIKFTSFSTLS